MANFFHDNPDLQFYFERGIDWARLVELTEYGYRTPDGFKAPEEAQEFYRQVVEMVGELAADEVAPRAARIDREGTRLERGEAVEAADMRAVFERVKALDLHRLCIPRELGGLNAPLLLYYINAELLARADVSVMTHYSFHVGIAMALLAYSLQEGTTQFDVAGGRITSTRFARQIDEIVRGEAWGCMDITEPDAGSDMAALRTVGEKDADGHWTVSGQKIFITSGHGKYHLVIARTESAGNGNGHGNGNGNGHGNGNGNGMFAGLGGLSMFLVQTYQDLPDGTRRRVVTIDRVEIGRASCRERV